MVCPGKRLPPSRICPQLLRSLVRFWDIIRLESFYRHRCCTPSHQHTKRSCRARRFSRTRSLHHSWRACTRCSISRRHCASLGRQHRCCAASVLSTGKKNTERTKAAHQAFIKESDNTRHTATSDDGFLVSAHALAVYDARLLETGRRSRCLIPRS